jgi:hypothetical protein
LLKARSLACDHGNLLELRSRTSPTNPLLVQVDNFRIDRNAAGT